MQWLAKHHDYAAGARSLGPNERYRLVGLGLSNFREAEQTAAQPPLFE
jgi:hypothetical protein